MKALLLFMLLLAGVIAVACSTTPIYVVSNSCHIGEYIDYTAEQGGVTIYLNDSNSTGFEVNLTC